MTSDADRDGHQEPGSTTLECRTEVMLDCSVIHVSGEVDLATVSILDRALEAAMAAPYPIVLDFEATRYIDSSGLQVLLRARRRHSARVAAAALAPTLRRVFELTKLDEVIPLYGTLQEALAALCQPSSASKAAGS